MEADGLLGVVKIWTPSWRGNRAQVLIRKRGHWRRELRATSWWEESLGLRVLNEITPRAALQAGLEVTRSEEGEDRPPDPPVGWRLTLALTSRMPARWGPDSGSPGAR